MVDTVDNDWSSEDIQVLLARIELNIPTQDRVVYSKRLKRIDWSKVAFKEYTADQCRDKWDDLQKDVRKYRLLREIVEDAKELIKRPGFNQNKNSMKLHPDFPKPPLSAFMMYCQKMRKKIVKEDPKADFISITKLVGERYKNLAPEKKEKYLKQYAEAREIHAKQLEKFYEDHPNFRPEKKPSKLPKIPLPSNALNKPTTSKDTPPKFTVKKPFTLFYENELSMRTSGQTNEQILEDARRKWRDLADADKLEWINSAKKHEEETVDKLKKYISEHPQNREVAAQLDNRHVLSKNEIAIVEKLAGKPKKPPKTAYGLYVQVKSQDPAIMPLPNKEKFAAVCEMWKACSAEEKGRLQDQINQMRDEYRAKFDEYLSKLPRDQQLAEIEAESATAATKRKTDAKDANAEIMATSKKIKVENTVDGGGKLFDNEPEAPPRTDFELFAQVAKKKQDLTKEQLLKIWQKVSAEDKNRFKEKLLKMKNDYIEAYTKFLKSLSPAELTRYKHMKEENKKSGHMISFSEELNNSKQSDDESSSDTTDSEPDSADSS